MSPERSHDGEPSVVHSVSMMGTVVTMQVVSRDTPAVRARLEQAVGWFQRVEDCCSRFNDASELRQLTQHIGIGVPASEMLFSLVQFALTIAEASGGAFDPTVGAAMERRGFDLEHRHGHRVRTAVDAHKRVSYRDVVIDSACRSIMLARPLLLDLGGVAKGLAIDMAARELEDFEHFAIDAGGDLYLAGLNARGEPWSIGIRHPRRDDEWLTTIRLSDRAVCTTGDYERRTDSGHHILDPRTGATADALASVTVVAPTAIAADALATAAFVMGPVEGVAFLERQGVQGLLVTSNLERIITRETHDGAAPLFSNT